MQISDFFSIYQRVVIIDFLRYITFASMGYFIFWVLLKKELAHRIIQKKMPKPKRMSMEFLYSMSTVVIFALVGTSIVLAKKVGYTRIYMDIDKYSWIWFIVSILLMMLIHDTWFYWTHRMMHHPKIYRTVHAVHHQSINPSPWAAYAFHPIEAVIEAGIYPLIVFTIPVHGLALFIFLIYMIIRNVIGHLGIEVFPRWFVKSKWSNWHTTTTHHDMHHKYCNKNFGFYFSWWDKWCGTEHKNYTHTFLEVTSRKSAQKKGK